jgi:CDGSH-type Zn-finger protein
VQNKESNNKIVITVNPGAFLSVEGNVTLKKQNSEIIKEGDRLFLCRCGASVNKPFCDGSHNRINFEK